MSSLYLSYAEIILFCFWLPGWVSIIGFRRGRQRYIGKPLYDNVLRMSNVLAKNQGIHRKTLV
jgi:hypothetical protein